VAMRAEETGDEEFWVITFAKDGFVWLLDYRGGEEWSFG
jgi:hypothetical protein